MGDDKVVQKIEVPVTIPALHVVDLNATLFDISKVTSRSGDTLPRMARTQPLGI